MAGPWEKHGKAWEDGDFTRKNGDLMGCRADFLLEYHCNNYGMWKLELYYSYSPPCKNLGGVKRTLLLGFE
jgi:hypothetical protein